jgi:ketosteroid isomerase-like protein
MKSSAEVTRAFGDYLDAIANGDVKSIDALLADDVILIGTDPAEWWTGHDTVVKAFATQMEEMGGGFPIRTANPQGFADGNVGWACDQPVLTMPDGAIPLRISAVFAKENGRWRVVHTHVSMGVKNEASLGKELTI